MNVTSLTNKNNLNSLKEDDISVSNNYNNFFFIILVYMTIFFNLVQIKGIFFITTIKVVKEKKVFLKIGNWKHVRDHFYLIINFVVVEIDDDYYLRNINKLNNRYSNWVILKEDIFLIWSIIIDCIKNRRVHWYDKEILK